MASQPLTLRFDDASSNSPRPFWYELEISSTSDFLELVHKANNIERPSDGGAVIYQVATALSPEQIYYWRVRALDGANTGPHSGVSSFEVITPVVLQAPNPLSPADGITIDSRRVTLIIGNVTASGPVRNPIFYTFELALDASFANLAVAPTVTQGESTTSVAHFYLDSDRLYYWRVRASTEARAGIVQSPWSPVNAFRSAKSPDLPPLPPPTGGGGGGAGDELDLSQVTWLHRNVSAWPVTSTVTNVSISPHTVCVDHTKAGRFPTTPFGDIEVEGNVWIFAKINGRWYGATWDWLRVGQTCKGVTAEEFGRDQIRISPMDSSWGPRAGDTIGFMMSTRARDNLSGGEERTNVVLVTWPY